MEIEYRKRKVFNWIFMILYMLLLPYIVLSIFTSSSFFNYENFSLLNFVMILSGTPLLIHFLFRPRIQFTDQSIFVGSSKKKEIPNKEVIGIYDGLGGLRIKTVDSVYSIRPEKVENYATVKDYL